MTRSTVAQEGTDIRRASDMIRLGARLQVLQSETRLSPERLSRLYRDIRGRCAPKGMFPYSPDWYLTWLPNLHSSVFYSIYNHFVRQGELVGIDAIIEAYKLYAEQVQAGFLPNSSGENVAVLTFTRAWTMLRFFDIGLLRSIHCDSCRGLFVAREKLCDDTEAYVCGFCEPPARAGRKAVARRRAQARAAAARNHGAGPRMEAKADQAMMVGT